MHYIRIASVCAGVMMPPLLHESQEPYDAADSLPRLRTSWGRISRSARRTCSSLSPLLPPLRKESLETPRVRFAGLLWRVRRDYLIAVKIPGTRVLPDVEEESSPGAKCVAERGMQAKAGPMCDGSPMIASVMRCPSKTFLGWAPTATKQ
ncbi:hypothetical protein Micbo1qcDRAFT_155545 [Microdochium bolleyi]|uniref:Uncharacterized protein n=1 Tax=Microdochium bolleyi TaxID=196109 RepID=A0A136JI86_9PEZI|nr:hypothetical protein Micbo1qcDRAFT_155545 [Microdochium bolleyi]